MHASRSHPQRPLFHHTFHRIDDRTSKILQAVESMQYPSRYSQRKRKHAEIKDEVKDEVKDDTSCYLAQIIPIEAVIRQHENLVPGAPSGMPAMDLLQRVNQQLVQVKVQQFKSIRQLLTQINFTFGVLYPTEEIKVFPLGRMHDVQNKKKYVSHVNVDVTKLQSVIISTSI